MSRYLLLACLAVTACASAQDQCLRTIKSELRTLNGLIASTEADIERGYTFTPEAQSTGIGISFCTGGVVQLCHGGSHMTPDRRPVAIDPEAEERKLATLKARRAQLQAMQCRDDGVRIGAAAF